MTMMTAATPIITPKRVRIERSLFAQRDCKATLMASVNSMAESESDTSLDGFSVPGLGIGLGVFSRPFGTESGLHRLPRTASWAKFRRPFGTRVLVGSSRDLSG